MKVTWNVEDNLQEFQLISDDELAHFKTEADRIQKTGKGVLANLGGAAFGDIALVPVPWIKHPRGIREIAEWYISTSARKDYVCAVFEKQCQISLENWPKINEAAGDVTDAIFVTGTDFGTHSGPFISPRAYRNLSKPFHKTVNDWIHKNT